MPICSRQIGAGESRTNSPGANLDVRSPNRKDAVSSPEAREGTATIAGLRYR
ncbi:hypothetical protein METHB2_40040 [Candidatus Methylobacter favarea]|uniref:Uncharacterized protein n=1 Tax=Candidatus Methylobacter favarea TaxID=2707345 RepID=A0A8S0X8P8_9GAMM|nr:hypothetical protein METHB2_40040 [Candidatus Methylobacter favarea]